MTTASALIASAMKKIGVLTKSETPDSDEAADGLVALNGLLSSWSNESLLVYSRVTESFTLSAGAAAYTIGTSQTFNTTRPVFIVAARITNGTTDTPVEVISEEIYNAIPVKTAQGVPELLNYNNAFSAGTIRLYPTPSSSYSLTLISEKPLVTLALTDTLSLPAGWERALTYNLALELAPEYGLTVDPLVVRAAMESKGAIAMTVAKNRPMAPTLHTGKMNILTGG